MLGTLGLPRPESSVKNQRGERKMLSIRNIVLMMLFALSLFATSCGGGAGEVTALVAAAQIASMDIVDAKSLFITSEISNAANIKLLKTTNNGTIHEVIYKDQNGSDVVEQDEPARIYDLNSQYYVVTYGDAKVPSKGYLVRKTDGAIYNLPTPPARNDIYTYKNAKGVQSDNNGNFYMIVQEGQPNNGVYKLDISDPNAITVQQYSPITDEPIAYYVTPEGHLYYFGNSINGSSSNRLRKSNGGIYNFPSGGWIPFWVGLNGNLKYQPGYLSETREVVIDASFNVTETVLPNPTPQHNDQECYLVEFPDRKFAVKANGTYSFIHEIENPTDTPREVPLATAISGTRVANSSDHIYISGNDASLNPMLIKVDPLTDITTTILPSGGVYYDIVEMSVSATNEVTFNALRMSDGVFVVGFVNSSGVLSILDETSNYKVTQLERIN